MTVEDWSSISSTTLALVAGRPRRPDRRARRRRRPRRRRPRSRRPSPLSIVTTRRNSDDSRAMTVGGDGLVVEAGLELEQAGQQLVLALGSPRGGRSRPSAARSRAERGVVRRAAGRSRRSRRRSRRRRRRRRRAAPWIGRKAKPTPFWTSRTTGFDEKAISSSVDHEQDDEGDRSAAGDSGGEERGHRSAYGGSALGRGRPRLARRPRVRLGDEDAVHRVELLEDDARCRGRRRSAGRRRRGPASGSPRRRAGRGRRAARRRRPGRCPGP